MTDKVQKIREEVVRLKSNLIHGACASQIAMETRCKEEAYDEVISLLDSLQKEPVSEFLNTESMIESYKQRLISQANSVKNSPLIDMCLASYKHGINETLDTLNLSNVQRTEKNRKEDPVSEELEAAAWLHYDKNRPPMPPELDFHREFISFFKAGSKWKEQQMIKETVRATIESDLDPHGADYGNQKIVCKWGELEAKKFKEGDKVKLIIIKED